LDADPVKGKHYFWEEKHERKKEQLEGKAVRARHTCKEDLTTLGLGFLQCIVRDDETRI
jgi:hypothetical protein